MHCTNVHYYFLVWQKWRLSTICMLIHVLLKLISLNLLCVFNSLSSSLSISITWSFPLQTVFYSIALGDCNKSNHKLMHKSMCTHCDQSVSSQYNCIFHYSNSRRIRQEKKCPCSPNKSAMDISTPKIDLNHEHFTPDISAEGNQPWTFHLKHYFSCGYFGLCWFVRWQFAVCQFCWCCSLQGGSLVPMSIGWLAVWHSLHAEKQLTKHVSLPSLANGRSAFLLLISTGNKWLFSQSELCSSILKVTLHIFTKPFQSFFAHRKKHQSV